MTTAPAFIGRRPLLVTGGAGFIGCNLADRLAGMGHDVLVLDVLARAGVEENLDWLKRRHPQRVSVVLADIRDRVAVARAADEAAAVFHLAAQVAVTSSLEDPAEDFAVNAGGTIALLEALRRRSGRIPLLFASTNKVYGDLADVELERTAEAWRPVDPQLRRNGVGESRPLDFHTPYGCSKGSADQYVLDYARSYGLPAAVLRMSCIYGPHQKGTEDQGWVAHFLIRALTGQQIRIYGDGHQVRDVLDVADAVTAWIAAWEQIERIGGRAFNLGGGPANAVSLLQVLGCISQFVGEELDVAYAGWRPGDQRWYVSDTRRVRAELDLPAPIPWWRGLSALAEWLGEEGAASGPRLASGAAS